MERALDCAEPEGALLWFLLPVPDLLKRHSRHRTAHAALIADILSLLAGRTLALPPAGPQPPLEPLSDREIRVLRYLPTNLTVPEIARELHVSHNTVETHTPSVPGREFASTMSTARRGPASTAACGAVPGRDVRPGARAAVGLPMVWGFHGLVG